jgi:hypothetical protein
MPRKIPSYKKIVKPPFPRLNSVLDQLLHHRGRPFDHLPRRQLAGESIGKKTNAAHASLNFRITPPIAVYPPWRAPAGSNFIKHSRENQVDRILDKK